MKKCPFCAEEIQDAAIKCKHCSEWLSDKSSVDSKIKLTPPRIACADGNCTGVLGGDGLCRTCGKSSEQVKRDLQRRLIAILMLVVYRKSSEQVKRDLAIETKVAPQKKKANRKRSGGWCIFIVVSWLIFIVVISGIILDSLYPDLLKSNKSVTSSQIKQQAQTQKEKARKDAAEKQRIINEFNQNSSQILNELKDEYQKGNFNEVVTLSSKYLPTKNQELLELNHKAKSELILIKLKTIPEKEYRLNRNLYYELVMMNPGNEKYRQKQLYYEGKLAEVREEVLENQRKAKKFFSKEEARRKKEQEERIARFGSPPMQSPWDGSYYVVERYLKRVANDPDSIDIETCTKVYPTVTGWLVACDYRGRNAFGGLVLQSNWFTIVNDTVINMEDSSAH